MKAVLLAAGKGTRLKPLIKGIPKVMIPINGKPILEYHIEQLAKAGIKNIFINLHYMPEKIKKYFRQGRKWGVNITYSYESELLGTAGAVKNLEEELESDSFLVVYGDNYHHIDYKDLINYSESKDGLGTLAVFNKENVLGTGIVSFSNNNKILRLKEKPNKDEIFSHWVSAGVFHFKKNIFQYIKEGFSDFGFDVFPELLKKDKVIYAYTLNCEVWGIDSPELLNELTSQKQ